MGMLLQSGMFNEDFNYGYPYNLQIPLSPAEFTYSLSERTYEGDVHPKTYARKQFTIHYLNRKDEPNNYDKGVHGGSQANNFFYIVFPLLQWNDVQTLSLYAYLSAPATLSYDRSFDGHKNDRVYVTVNRKIMKMHSHSAGHGWTTDSCALRAGWNNITWVLQTATYTPPVVRGGTPQASKKPPNLPRYLRLTNINISANVTRMPFGLYPWIPMSSDTVATFRGTVNAKPRVTMKCTSYMGKGRPAGEVDMWSTSSFLTDAQQFADEGATNMPADSSLTAAGSSDQFHESYDAGFGVEAYGDLSMEVPIDTPQTVLNDVKSITAVTVTMPTPIIVQGRPVLPTYYDTQHSTFSSGHTYVYNDAPAPTSINHVLPTAPTYRWVATDVGGADDSAITSWPEHSGGPAWQSTGIYSPTVHSHEFFHDESISVQTYSRVVHMWWRYVQHMWLNLGATQSVPYSWVITGLFHPMSPHQWNYVLDFGNPTPTGYDDQVNAGEQVIISDGVSSGGLLGLSYGGTSGTTCFHVQTSSNQNLYRATIIPATRPIVLTFVRWSSTVTNCYVNGYKLSNHFSFTGPTTGNQTWLLGRQKNYISELHASHMSLFEIAYFNRTLNDDEVKIMSDYLAGVYLFNKYK